MSDHNSMKHPKVVINEAKKRFIDSIKGNALYEIVKYEVFMCDDIYSAEKNIVEEMKERGISLPENIELLWFIEVAQYEVAKENLVQRLERSSLTEQERSDISFLNACYPLTVSFKSRFVDEFTP